MSTLTASSMTASRWKSLSSSERVQIRQFQLKQIEQEQLVEDRAALRMTEEERETLLSSFISVKTEFYDLDGLSWADSCDELTGIGFGRSSYMQNHSAPSEITNSPVIGLGSSVVQQSPKIPQSKSRARIKRKDVENDSGMPRFSAPCFSYDYLSHRNRSQGSYICFPKPQHIRRRRCSSPMSIFRDNGIASAFQLPNEHWDWRWSYLDIRSAITCWSEISLQQIVGLPLFGGWTCRTWEVERECVGSRTADLWARRSLWEVTNSAGSHLELSGTFDLDIDVHGDDSIAARADIPSTSISGLPQSTVSGWPSPFLAWNPAPPVSEVPQVSSFSLAVPLSPPVATQSPNISDVTLPVPPSTASRWLEIYHSHPSSPQVQVSEVAGLGLGLTTAMSPESSHLPLSQAFDIQHGRRQAFRSKHISGLPHSSISQWPEFTSSKAYGMPGSDSGDVAGFGSSSSSSSSSSSRSRSRPAYSQWSLCPRSSPQSSETLDTSCAFASSQ